MALRDFDRVRERMELHVERRHVALAALGASALLGCAFWAGWQLASEQTRRAAGQSPQVAAAPPTTIAPPPLPLPAAEHMADRPPPVLPTPVATAARRRELARRTRTPASPRALAPMLEEVARNAGRSAVASDQVADEPRMAEAEADAEHTAPSDAPTSMLGRLPVPAVVRRGRSTKGAALAEAFGDAAEAPPSSRAAGVPAEWVQSLPPRADATTEDPSLGGQSTSAALGVALPLSPAGAALHSPVDAGGLSLDRPAWTPTQMREAARQRMVDALDREAAAARAKVAAAARAKAEAEARAKAQAEAAARKQAEALAAAKAARVAAAAAEAAQQAERKAAAAAAAQAKRDAQAQAKALAAQAQREALAKAKAAAAAKRETLAKAKAAAAQAKREALAKAHAAQAKRRAQADAASKRQEAAQSRAEAKPAGDAAAKRVFWVQLKSLRDGKEAAAFAKAMRAKGYKVVVHRAEVPKMGAFHRVRIGPFTSQAQAKTVEQRFRKRESMEAMVMSGQR